MAIELITGRAGRAHVDSSDVRAFNAYVNAEGRYVLHGGGATIESANNLRVLPAEILMDGAHVRITGTGEEVTLENGASSYDRIDIVALHYTSVGSDDSRVESVTLEVIKGTPVDTGGGAQDPAMPVPGTSILDGSSEVYVPYIRVRITGLVPGDPEEILPGREQMLRDMIAGLTLSDVPGTMPISKGGTGATTADGAADTLKLVRYATNPVSTITGARVENDPQYNQRVNLWTEGAGGYGLITEDVGISLYNGSAQKAVWALKPDSAASGVFRSNRTPTLTSLAWSTIYNLAPGGYLVGQNAASAPNGETGYGNLLIGRSGGDRVVALLAYDNGHIYSIYGEKGVGWKRLTEGGSALDFTRVWAGTANPGATVTCNQAVNTYPLIAVRVKGGQHGYQGVCIGAADWWEYSGGTANNGGEFSYNCYCNSVWNSLTHLGAVLRCNQANPTKLIVDWAGNGSQNSTYGSIQNLQEARIEEVYVLATRYGSK